MYEEISQETQVKARAALMDALWEQFEGMSDEEILDGRGAAASVEIDGTWFFTRTENSKGLPEGAEIDPHLEWLCNEALDRMQSGETEEDAQAAFRAKYWMI